VQNDALLMGKLRLVSISWTQRVFCSSIIDSYQFDGSSYLNKYCSLVFLCMFSNVFINSKKAGFQVFYSQINVLTSMIHDRRRQTDRQTDSRRQPYHKFNRYLSTVG